MSYGVWKYGFVVDDRVEVVAPLSEHYECTTGTIRSIYIVGNRQRFRIQFDDNEWDDFFGSELRRLDQLAAS